MENDLSFLNDDALIELPVLKHMLALGGRKLPPRIIARLAKRLEGGPALS